MKRIMTLGLLGLLFTACLTKTGGGIDSPSRPEGPGGSDIGLTADASLASDATPTPADAFRTEPFCGDKFCNDLEAS